MGQFKTSIKESSGSPSDSGCFCQPTKHKNITAFYNINDRL